MSEALVTNNISNEFVAGSPLILTYSHGLNTWDSTFKPKLPTVRWSHI